MSAIGTWDERKPVAFGVVGAGAVEADACGAGAGFATGLEPPHAASGSAATTSATERREEIRRSIGVVILAWVGGSCAAIVRDDETERPRVITVERSRPDPAVIAEAAALLRSGRLVAFPTETVYGLGGLALEPASLRRIYEAKGRPSAHPIIAHVLGEDDARELTRAWSPLASRLARAFWPGPLTIVTPKSERVPAELTGGSPSVGLRAPAHPIARALIAAVGQPVAAPSANKFQSLSPTRAEHVARSLGAAVDLVLDGGPCDRGIESTVVSLAEDGTIRVLRPGSVTLDDLRAHGPVVFESLRASENELRDSPGLDAKHYAPRARLVLASRSEIRAAAAPARRAGVIFVGQKAEMDAAEIRELPDEAHAFAAALFATMHELDAAGCDVIVVEAPPETEAWIAVRDRLARAAS